ncbi:MAG TPA: hypothetical protein VLI54_07330 [Bacillota bacterium]|nr:hypothetical protein [Bacillota bacterium]
MRGDLSELEPIGEGVVYGPDTGYIMLHLPQLALPDTVTVDGLPFSVKSEFHCSLLNARRLLGGQNGDREKEIVASVASHLAVKGVALEGYRGDLYHCIREEGAARQSIIGMVSLRGIDELYKHLRGVFDRNLPSPVPHVTLYTYASQFGIGVPNERALADYCRPLGGPVADAIRPILLST